MARMFQWVGISFIGAAALGCVSQEKYNALKLDRDQYAERLGTAERDAHASEAEADAYKHQLEQIARGSTDQQGLLTNLTQQVSDLQRENDDLNRKYAEAMNRPIGLAALPAPLNDALTQFAEQNPDLVDFDSARGVVKFKSDVTFATGSAEVTPKAEEVITRFAQILNSPAAAHYELMVVGHTDNQRVVNARTIAQGHKDNWYLSAHRAISVGESLQRESVSPTRLEIAGCADERPIASNSSEGGRSPRRSADSSHDCTRFERGRRRRRACDAAEQAGDEQGRRRDRHASASEQVIHRQFQELPRPGIPNAGAFFFAIARKWTG
jgi:chemotaxis protein MotB